MIQKFDKNKTVLLEQSGKIYQTDEGRLHEILPEEISSTAILRGIAQDPTRHFFKTPYHSALYIVEESVVGSVNIHHSSFYPGSPFDTFKAIEQFYKEGTLIIPRFYLYPTGICNSSCHICQFHNLDRFRGKPFSERYMPYETVERAIGDFSSMGSGLASISVVVSGDGEPTEHPEISRILYKLRDKGIRTFLTSNLRLPKDTDRTVMRSIIESIDMITVSIKGLSDSVYNRYQGTNDKVAFGQVLGNLENLVQSLEQSGRREEVLVGVATLILPENTGSYRNMIGRFIQLGIDYVYINPVEPSYKRWGIGFTEDQQDSTQKFLDSLASLDCGRTVIRYPGTLRLNELQRNVYFDATNRVNTEVCGSALWNPTIITTDTHGKTGARILSCRSSQNFGNSNFWYADGWNPNLTQESKGLSHLLAQRRQQVMDATLGCTDCRLERQVIMFEQVITLMKRHDYKGSFMLEFDVDDLVPKGKAITFELTK
jgi:wyosine [tRNA(Phe)-imidazoG37] synthetase (radical SAM superfamily)